MHHNKTRKDNCWHLLPCATVVTLIRSVLLLNFLVWITPFCQAATLLSASGQHGMVVTTQHEASLVGVNILKQGGNAIDAAVAVGYALAVANPSSGNLGGGGFMTIHLANGNNTFINFRETAPQEIHPRFFLNKQGKPDPALMQFGYLPVGVPGTVKGLNFALQKYGTMKAAQVIDPAISLAENGFILAQQDVDFLKQAYDYFKTQPNVAAIFLNHGKPWKVGDRLKQLQLAKTLSLIRDQGDAVFYQGSIADEIVKESKAHHGILTKEDFTSYTVTEEKPIVCSYRNQEIITAPPPSSGGVTLCEMLNVLQGYPIRQLGYRSSMAAHYTLEAMRYAYADRNRYLGDPQFVKNPVANLLSPGYAAKIRSHIKPNRATDSRKIGIQFKSIDEGHQTTHYSVVDQFGNAVAVTYTLNSNFGAKVIAGNTGFFLNNELDDFTLLPGVANQFQLVQGDANKMASKKRPLSSMTPTIVMHDSRINMVLGSPGGSTIINTVLLILQSVIDYGMNIEEAVKAPRFHMQWLPDKVFIEENAFSSQTMQALNKMGYQFQSGSPYHSETWGAANVISQDPSTKIFYGSADPRRPAGLAAGY